MIYLVLTLLFHTEVSIEEIEILPKLYNFHSLLSTGKPNNYINNYYILGYIAISKYTGKLRNTLHNCLISQEVIAIRQTTKIYRK